MPKTRPEHLFVSSSSGCLYDTREPNWSLKRPLRWAFEGTNRHIGSVADLKATLRAGPYAWPGGYQLYFITNDGAALSFDTVRAELRNVIEAITHRLCNGWRVIACDINYEDTELYDDHTDEKIPSAHGDDEPASETAAPATA